MKPELWTADEKLAIILEGFRGDRSVPEIRKNCRITPAPLYRRREKILASARRSLEMVHEPYFAARPFLLPYIFSSEIPIQEDHPS